MFLPRNYDGSFSQTTGSSRANPAKLNNNNESRGGGCITSLAFCAASRSFTERFNGKHNNNSNDGNATWNNNNNNSNIIIIIIVII